MSDRSGSNRRCARRAAVIVGVLLIGVVTGPTAAPAETYQSTVGTSSGVQTTGAGFSVSITATLSSTDRARNLCIDSFFDWNVVEADGDKRHYDARVVRNCDVGALTRSKWVDDFTGLTVTGTRKAGSCLVVGTDSQGRFGTRVSCVHVVGASVAPCGYGSASCYIRKNGVLLKTGWNFPQSSSL